VAEPTDVSSYQTRFNVQRRDCYLKTRILITSTVTTETGVPLPNFLLTSQIFATYRITRGLVLTRPSVDRKKAHLCTTNTFISILFLREESSRQRYLDSYLQDNFGDMQYSASNPVRTEFHFSALHHGDYDVLWGAELWFVVCGCVLVRK
jgi:hypothetical protein